MSLVISVKNLTKEFRIPEKPSTKLDKVLFYFRRKWKPLLAVQNVSFDVKEGEFLGLLGPNGSGKTTIIKMLSGVLTPNSGKVEVLGYTPHERKTEFLKKIGVFFGNRSNLWFDIPLEDSFLFYKDLYGLTDSFYDNRMNLLKNLLELDDLLSVPVRKLSFGQRMRGEIGVTFLHKPEIVFLDEPTIGLDIIAKWKIHKFLKKINKQEKTTIILTTHQLNDVEELCERIILMDKGKVLYDGRLSLFKKRYVRFKEVMIDYLEVKNKPADKLVQKLVKDKSVEGTTILGKVSLKNQNKLLSLLSKAYRIKDFELKEPNLEKVIHEMYERHKEKGKEHD